MSEPERTERVDAAEERRRRIGEMRYQLVDAETQLRYVDPDAAPVTKVLETFDIAQGSAQVLLAHAVEDLSQGFVLFDAEDRLVLCNRKYREFYPEIADLLTAGRTYGEIADAAAQRAQRGQMSIRLDGWVRRNAPPEAAVSEEEVAGARWVSASEQRIEGGGRVGVRTDITDLHRREEMLRESRQRFRDIAGAASDWFWESSPDLALTYVSERLSQITGRRADALLGETHRAVSGDAAADWSRLEAAVAARKPFRDFAYRLKDRNGVWRHMRVSGQPVLDGSGAVTGYRGAGRDVTATTAVPAAARRELDALEQAIEADPAVARQRLAALRKLIDSLEQG
jgi:PAS domain S-box-containing protein